MRYKNHSNHIDILKEFYYANKYILTEQMKDTLIDAIECMEYIESDKELESTNESPTREDTDDESSREKMIQYIKSKLEAEEEYYLCPVCGGSGREKTLFSQKTCTACNGKGKLSRFFEIEGYPGPYIPVK